MGCSPISRQSENLRGYILDIKDSPIRRGDQGRKSTHGHRSSMLEGKAMVDNIKVVVEEDVDPFERYSNPNLIKDGRVASVYTVIHTPTGKKRAMKVFNLQKMSKEDFTQDDLANQIQILKVLSHPNIIQLYEVFTYRKKVYMIYEYCAGGNLLDLLEKDATFSEQNCRNIMFQILSAVNYCHSKGIAHHDLCPEHILFENTRFLGPKDKEGPNACPVKIINFGSYRLFSTTASINSPKKRRKTISTGYKPISNPYFASPESKLSNDLSSLTEKCDIWSCGVLMYLLLSGELPFKEDYTTVSPSTLNIAPASTLKLKFHPVEIWDNISTESKDLVKSLLMINPQKRPTAGDALKSPFFTQSGSFITKAVNKKQFTTIVTNMRRYNYKYKLHDAITSYMVHHLMKKEDIATMRKYFSVFDKNHDGRISRKELEASMEQIMTPIQASIECNKILKSLNKEKDDEIEYEEFIKSAVDMDKIVTEKNVKLIFDLIDKDKSGSVSKFELKNFFLGALSTDSLMADDKEFSDLIKEIDFNGDGEINYAEFKKMMLK